MEAQGSAPDAAWVHSPTVLPRWCPLQTPTRGILHLALLGRPSGWVTSPVLCLNGVCVGGSCVRGPEPLPGRGEWLVHHRSWWRCRQRGHSHTQADSALDGVCRVVPNPWLSSRGAPAPQSTSSDPPVPGLACAGHGVSLKGCRWFQMVWPRYGLFAVISFEHLFFGL